MKAREDFWEEAVRRHDRQVFLSLLCLGLSPDRARDIAQSAWTALLEKEAAGQLAQVELPGLVIKQARFLALNRLRAEGSERRALQVVDSEKTGPDAMRSIISRAELDAAIDALSKSSDNTKKIFKLVYGNPSHTHADVARIVGLSLQRVRQIISDTRHELRKAIEQGGI